MNTAIFMLRSFQLGLSIADLENLEVGSVMDMIIESSNDSYKYQTVATQADFDKF